MDSMLGVSYTQRGYENDINGMGRLVNLGTVQGCNLLCELFGIIIG